MPKELRATTSHRASPFEGRGSQSQPSVPPLGHAGHRNAAVWSDADDQILTTARASGLNWQPIATRHFPSKTANACRKRHERLMERRNHDDWDGRKIDALAREYMECRKEMWSMLAARVGERWAVVEAKCMEKGLKNLQAVARAASKRAVASERAQQQQQQQQRGNVEENHEGDSGIGCSDEDAEMEVGEGSSHMPVASDLPIAQPAQAFALPPLPLYQPPMSAVARGAALRRPRVEATFSGLPFGGEQQSRSPDEQNQRAVSIRSMLSHPEGTRGMFDA